MSHEHKQMIEPVGRRNLVGSLGLILERKRIGPTGKRILVGSLGLAVPVLLMFGCSSGSATSAVEVQKRQATAGGQAASRGNGSLHEVPWNGRPGQKRQFILFAFVGYCSHGPKPYPERVRVRRKAKRVILTLLVHFPPRAHPCLGEEIGLRTAVKIRGSLQQLRLYDGSQSPAVQRWPHP